MKIPYKLFEALKMSKLRLTVPFLRHSGQIATPFFHLLLLFFIFLVFYFYYNQQMHNYIIKVCITTVCV